MVNLTAIKKMKKRNFFSALKKEFDQEKKYSFEEEQSQALADIGHKLRRFREKNSISLERVAVVTMIRMNLLQAIEEGNLAKLPEPIYTQKLIKRYADTMGLNGEKLADLFPTQKIQESKKSLLNFSMPHLRPHHLYLLYILIIVLSVSSFHHLIRGSDFLILGSKSSTKQDNQTEKRLKGNSDLVAQASSGNIKNQQNSSDKTKTAKSQKQVEVSVIFKEDSWVSIEIDGKLEFEDTLTKGTQKTWKAKKEIVFFAGNAGGILIPLNDGQTMQLGKPGEVKEVVFTAADTQVSQSKNAKN